MTQRMDKLINHGSVCRAKVEVAYRLFGPIGVIRMSKITLNKRKFGRIFGSIKTI